MSVMQRAGSPNWFIEFTHKGRPVRKTSGVPMGATKAEQKASKKEAEAIEQRWRDEIDAEIKDNRSKADLAFVMTRYFNAVIKPKDAAGTDYHKKAKAILRHFKPETLVADISAEKISLWKDGMLAGGALEHQGNGVWKANKDRGLKVRSVNAYLACLRAVLKKCASAEWNYLKASPEIVCVKGKKPKLRFLDQQEAIALIRAAAPDKFANGDSMHLQQLMRFLLGTGARKHEALELTWNRVRLMGNGMASVLLDGKGDKERTVPIGDALRQMLIEMRRAQQAGGYTGNKVFVYFVKGEWMEIEGVSSSFLTARRKAGLGTDVTLHTLRHTYASWHAQADTPMKKLAELLGHSTVTTTDLYAHLAPQHLESSVEKLEASMMQLAA